MVVRVVHVQSCRLCRDTRRLRSCHTTTAGQPAPLVDLLHAPIDQAQRGDTHTESALMDPAQPGKLPWVKRNVWRCFP
jgi:hypothetical protein